MAQMLGDPAGQSRGPAVWMSAVTNKPGAMCVNKAL